MRMTRKAAIYASGKKVPVALTLTKQQWTNRVQASLLNGGTVGHDSSNRFYALALTFTAPKNMKKLTMSFSGRFYDYQNGAQYRCGVASALPENNATEGTVFHTGTRASASTGTYATVTASAEISGSFTQGTSYTVWLWTSGTPTGSVSYINNTTITMEGT